MLSIQTVQLAHPDVGRLTLGNLCSPCLPPPQLLRTGGLGELSSAPLWGREGLSDDELISEFQKECRIIRQGLEGDLCKVRGLLGYLDKMCGANEEFLGPK